MVAPFFAGMLVPLMLYNITLGSVVKMVELIIEEAGQEQHRQQLGTGRFYLGRSPENEIAVPNRNISRQHLQLELKTGQVMVKDLGSTNGARMNGRALVPHQPTPWPFDSSVEIGPLRLMLRPLDRPESAAVAASFAGPQLGPQLGSAAPAGLLVARIVSNQARNQLTTLPPGAVFAGSDPSCAIHLAGHNIGPHHCRLTFSGDRVDVTNLEARWPAQLGGETLVTGQTRSWPPNQPLQIGSAMLYLSLAPAAPAQTDTRGYWRYALLAASSGGFLLFCLVSILAAWGLQRGGCSAFGMDCLIALLPAEAQPTPGTEPPGVATPTAAPTRLAPTAQPSPTRPPQIIATYAAAVAAADCRPGQPQSVAANAGWLDLPFPYQGIEPLLGGPAEQFRLISRRSRVGGRINSFFDHEFPVYPGRFGGWEPADSENSMVIFTGQRVNDAFAQDVSDGYWYSGHAGIDFSPVNSREATTPVLAAADGLLYRAEIDVDGNHMVWLIHDPDGDGFYQYATLYFHLHPDHYFEAMVAQRQTAENVPLAAGSRIGTMGTTGRSTGIHLHFEVRRRTSRNAPFGRLDTVDPYGFSPSGDFPASPWSEAVTLFDAGGNPRERRGGPLDYLWIHPLTAVDEGETAVDDCPPPVTEARPVFEIEVDIYPILGYSVVHPGFTFLARDNNRNILDYAPRPVRREMILELREEDRRCGITVDDVFWSYRLPGENQEWNPFPALPYRQDEAGRYVFEAMIRDTARYILVAKQSEDCVPPQTTIQLTGETDGDGAYLGSVAVMLRAFDSGFPGASGISETVYSLDCGSNWIPYRGQPFVVTRETPHDCGAAGEGEQGVALAANEFVLLASSTDRNNNIEEPPRQVRFTIR
jgi:murein DD-endopeptidase MepM/ murein hydrolase activator NlpD